MIYPPVISKNPLDQKDFIDRKLSSAIGSLAANAGATNVWQKAVKPGEQVYIKAIAFLSADGGVDDATLPVSAISTLTGVFTSAAHGLTVPTPVIVAFTVGGSQPTGATAGLVYWAAVTDANDVTLYDTLAHAVAAGSTGKLVPSVAGADVVLVTVTANDVLEIAGAVVNRNGTLKLVGASTGIATLQDLAAWAVALSVDNTNLNAIINITPDTTLATNYKLMVESFECESDIA